MAHVSVSESRPSVKSLLIRARMAWADKDQWRDILEEAYELASPMRNPYDFEHSAGARRKDRVFDSTLQQSLFRFSSRPQSEITPPPLKWAPMIPGPLVPPSLDGEFKAD